MCERERKLGSEQMPNSKKLLKHGSQGTYDFRLERRLNFPGFNFFPVNPPKELVTSNVLFSLVASAETLSRILG